MAKKEKKQSEGAPEWMVTYGDMMTLLLCFFVMIVAMSEIKRDERYRVVVESIRKEFGYKGGVGSVPTSMPPDVSPIQRQQAQADVNFKLKRAESVEDSQVGRHERVTRIHEGKRFTTGGVTAFAEGRAELLPEAYEALGKIASRIRGTTHVVEIRGHTSAAPLPKDSPYADHMQLSVARAEAVRNWMIGMTEDRGRIDPRRIRVVGVGDYEPAVQRAYDPVDRARNDRVEIVVLEAIVSEFEGEKIRHNPPGLDF